MSIPQNYRLINIDLLDPESPSNFDLSTLVSSSSTFGGPSSAADAQHVAGQVRQLLRGGDAEGALRGALENVPYGGDDRAKVGACKVVVSVEALVKKGNDGKRVVVVIIIIIDKWVLERVGSPPCYRHGDPSVYQTGRDVAVAHTSI